jgi:beta-lactamase class A
MKHVSRRTTYLRSRFAAGLKIPARGFCGAGFLLILLFALPVMRAEPLRFVSDSALQNSVEEAVRRAVGEFSASHLGTNELAVTLVDAGDPAHLRHAAFRGAERIYPASVIKLFYLEAAHRWMQDGRIQDTAELRRAMRDMIVDSSNDATHYIVDLITGTCSGPELGAEEMREWAEKRNAVNRYFAGRGYRNINVNQKPWCEGPYGRERIFVGENYTNRNALTTDATARLLCEIVLGRCVTAERSREMLELMRRDPFAGSSDPDDQAHGFSGPALPPGAKLWSKAGWTSETRHDAAYIELPDGAKRVLVIFTVNHANDRRIIPFLAREILQRSGKQHERSSLKDR